MTVVIPARDREQFVGAALRSVAAQSWRPRAVLVVDDASVDATADVASAHGATVIRRQSSTGIGAARNAGIELADTEWIAFLDSDDVWSPRHLETALRKATSAHVLVTMGAISTDGRVLGNASKSDLALTPESVLESGELISTSSTLVRRANIVRAGYFSDLPQAEDLQLWIRVLQQGPGLATTDITARYAVHAEQVSRDGDLMRRCVLQVLAECEQQTWFDQRHGRQRALARTRWDAMRAAHRAGDWRGALGQAVCLLTAPASWGAMYRVLRQRRWRRHRSQLIRRGRAPGFLAA